MTTKITKESLAENIGRLESYGDLSINEEYQLKAYRLLIDLLPDECVHRWRFGSANTLQKQKQCVLCGRVELYND